MKFCCAIVVWFALLVNVFPQEPQPSPSPAQTLPPAVAPQKPREDADDVVRITTNLVQVDATVTDKNGKQVTSLTADDFEITENGKPQKITNFNYISAASPAAVSTPTPSKKDSKGNVPLLPPAAALRPEQVHRAVALVVDDLRMSAESLNAARESLRKYINQQLQPGDLVAIIRTSTGVGSLQQFTNDRQQLMTAVDHLKTIARADGRAGAFTSANLLDRIESQVSEGFAGDDEASADRRKREALASGALGATLRASDADRSETINEFRDKLLTVGTLGALNFVVRGLRDLPGRKAVVLFSDGIFIFSSDAGDRNARVLTALRQLIDRANRSSVVFYTIDARGLQTANFEAADNTAGGAASPANSGPVGAITGVGSITPELVGQKILSSRTGEIFEGQNGLHYLADETGGLALINNNDLNRAIRRALEDIAGYYVIGYRPEESVFDPGTGHRQFNKLNVKLKNHGDYKIRSRSGFMGVPDDASRVAGRTASEQLVAALLSPFSASELDLQLSSFFINDETAGSAVRSILRFDANKLTFTQQPDGQYEAVINILGVTLGETGQIIDQVSRLEKIRVSPATLERFKAEGMVGGLNVPVAKPGAYLLRVAVRDEHSGKIGSAGQYIEIPNLNAKEGLVLSSLVISGNNTEGSIRRQSLTDLVKSLAGNAPPAGRQPAAPPPANQIFVPGGEGMVGTEDAKAGPASRRFRNKMFLNFACLVYSGKRDGRKLQLTSQVRLFHDGQEVFIGEPTPIDMTQQNDFKRLVIARRLFLGTILEPGDYVLHLTIADNTSNKTRAATRWLDFRIDPN
jgi:VWFA-related protein